MMRASVGTSGNSQPGGRHARKFDELRSPAPRLLEVAERDMDVGEVEREPGAGLILELGEFGHRGCPVVEDLERARGSPRQSTDRTFARRR